MTFNDYSNWKYFYANNEKISHGGPGTVSVADSFITAQRKGMQSVPEMKLDLEERFVQGQSEDWDRTNTGPSGLSRLFVDQFLNHSWGCWLGLVIDWQDNWQLSEKILYCEVVRINRFGINQWIISHCEFRKWHISSPPLASQCWLELIVLNWIVNYNRQTNPS